MLHSEDARLCFQSAGGRHLGRFRFLAVMSSTAVDIHVHASVCSFIYTDRIFIRLAIVTILSVEFSEMNCHYHPSPELFNLSKLKLSPLNTNFLSPGSHSASSGSECSGASYKWNRTVSGRFHLAPLTSESIPLWPVPGPPPSLG